MSIVNYKNAVSTQEPFTHYLSEFYCGNLAYNFLLLLALYKQVDYYYYYFGFLFPPLKKEGKEKLTAAFITSFVFFKLLTKLLFMDCNLI